MGRKKLLICQEQENGSTVRNRKAIGLSRKGGTREPSVCQEGQPLVYQKQRRTAGLPGIGQLSLCQEPQSSWSVRKRRAVGLSGIGGLLGCQDRRAVALPRRKLLVCQERWSSLPTKNICRSGRNKGAVGLSGTQDSCRSVRNRRGIGLSATGQEHECGWSEADRSMGLSGQGDFSRSGTGALVACQEQELSVKETKILWSVRNKIAGGLSVRGFLWMPGGLYYGQEDSKICQCILAS